MNKMTKLELGAPKTELSRDNLPHISVENLNHARKQKLTRQDTNGLALHTLAPVLGVSKSMDLEVNSMAVPRKARQAVGGIAKLKHDDGRQMTVRE